MTLLGRDRECATIDAVLEGARQGRSGALLVSGPAGIGKSALLEYAARSAHDFQVVRAAGVESEMELAFSGLQQRCAPLLDGLPALPEPQRVALETAFGLGEAPHPIRCSLLRHRHAHQHAIPSRLPRVGQHPVGPVRGTLRRIEALKAKPPGYAGV